jgi:hypothetical protein
MAGMQIKAAEGRRSPKPGGITNWPGKREASWSAPALWAFECDRNEFNHPGFFVVLLGAQHSIYFLPLLQGHGSSAATSLSGA